MCAARWRDSGRGLVPDDGERAPGAVAICAVLGTVLVLMGFSIAAWAMDNPTLAAGAGVLAVTVAEEIVRRLLPIGGRARDADLPDDRPGDQQRTGEPARGALADEERHDAGSA